MQNISIETEGSVLVIKIDTSKSCGASASGKSTIIGSTQGNVPVKVNGHTFKLGVNCYNPR